MPPSPSAPDLGEPPPGGRPSPAELVAKLWARYTYCYILMLASIVTTTATWLLLLVTLTTILKLLLLLLLLQPDVKAN